MSPHSKDAPLGKPGEYPDGYSPDLLRPIPRAEGRSRLGIGEPLPFTGTDVWNSYELAWLNPAGKPVAGIGEFRFPATSPNLIESKSLKLYLNSLSGTRYASPGVVETLLGADLGRVAGADTEVRVAELASAERRPPGEFPGTCLDDADLAMPRYELNPELLDGSTEAGVPVAETLYSHLFKTNCPVTGQPDWASILVRYRGPSIERERLLAYLVSYRHHAEFHEQCVERVFVDIERHCRPEALTVYARYTRRGGLDINPFRSNFEETPENVRLLRQ